MKAKDKRKKIIKITIKNILIFSVSILILLNGFIFYHYYFTKNEVYAKETSIDAIPDVTISQAEEIDLEAMLEENTKAQQTEEYVVEEVDLEYLTQYKSNPELPKGMIQVIQEGRGGKQEITTKKVYENGTIINEEQVSSKVTKAAVNKIVEIGTGSGSYNYQVKVGDTVYVTSDRASIMVEPSENSQKIATLTKGKELTVLDVEEQWYQITGGGTNGYIKVENTTFLNQNQTIEEEQQTQNAVTPLSFTMQLNQPSGLSLEQFKQVLTDSKDKNHIFQNNAQYFYYIEKQYNINGLFVAAVGIHESAWGTSKIAIEKHNLFGYGAYDSNPYNGAYQFSDYSECIDLIARVFVKYYLNPEGTEIYGGEKASGKYYNGATLSGVNKRYATDTNWANGVYRHMEYLYNKL